ncbi:MAG: SIS domain-containing protein [Nitrospirota bacterium]
MRERIEGIFKESAEVKLRFVNENLVKIEEIVDKIVSAFKRGNKLILFGNGGSAADASHIAAEFVNRFKMNRRPLPAIALNTDMAVITSISNDFDYSESISKQLDAIGKEDDMVIAISTSGNSSNIIRAVELAREKSIFTIGFTGGKGGRLSGLVDSPFIVPSENTPRIQETHITLGHLICELVEERLFPLK